MSRDLARERLKEIRSLQGWREAYKVAGLDDQGDPTFSDKGKNATKRRRLSRLVNPRTSGAKKIEGKQRQKVNRAYRYRRDKGVFSSARAEAAIKAINKSRRDSLKRANQIFGARGTNPNPTRLATRKRQYAQLTDEEKDNLREAFANADQDGGKALRAEYSMQMSKVNTTALTPARRRDFSDRLVKAQRAEWRDDGTDKSFDDWVKEKYGTDNN
jgi:hypothetical protein